MLPLQNLILIFETKTGLWSTIEPITFAYNWLKFDQVASKLLGHTVQKGRFFDKFASCY